MIRVLARAVVPRTQRNGRGVRGFLAQAARSGMRDFHVARGGPADAQSDALEESEKWWGDGRLGVAAHRTAFSQGNWAPGSPRIGGNPRQGNNSENTISNEGKVA